MSVRMTFYYWFCLLPCAIASLVAAHVHVVGDEGRAAGLFVPGIGAMQRTAKRASHARTAANIPEPVSAGPLAGMLPGFTALARDPHIIAPGPGKPRGGRTATMELEEPVDSTTVARLIRWGAENVKQGLIVVLHFKAAEGLPIRSDYSYAPTLLKSMREFSKFSDDFDKSEKAGGRPVVFLVIDRDRVGFDLHRELCVKYGVKVFPTLQVWSRGSGQDVEAGELRRKLLRLGAASRVRAAPAPAAALQPREPTGAALEPREPAGAARDLAAGDAKREAMLDVLWGEPDLDDEDLPPPV